MNKTIEELAREAEHDFSWWDKNVNFPFYRNLWCHVENVYYGLKHLPGNLKKWAVFVWYDRDWDYAHTLEAMEIKCRSQSKSIGEYGNSIDMEKHSLQALEMANVLKRLREEEYWDDMVEMSPTKTHDQNYEIYKNSYEKGMKERDADIQYLKDHIEELFSWWE